MASCQGMMASAVIKQVGVLLLKVACDNENTNNLANNGALKLG